MTDMWKLNSDAAVDIVAYRGLTPVQTALDDRGRLVCAESFRPLEHCTEFKVPDLLSFAADGLLDASTYRYEELKMGWSGSTALFLGWLEMLARVGGYKPKSFKLVPGEPSTLIDSFLTGAHEAGEGPFMALLHLFASEGTIGPVTSAKLAKDFAAFDEVAKTPVPGKFEPAQFFYPTYCKLRECFEMASQNGAVTFALVTVSDENIPKEFCPFPS